MIPLVECLDLWEIYGAGVVGSMLLLIKQDGRSIICRRQIVAKSGY